MNDERDQGATPAGENPEEVGADTGMWQAFAKGSAEPERPRAVGAPFRVLTLLGGLVVFALIVWLLLR